MKIGTYDCQCTKTTTIKGKPTLIRFLFNLRKPSAHCSPTFVFHSLLGYYLLRLLAETARFPCCSCPFDCVGSPLSTNRFFSGTGSDASDLRPLSGDGPVTVERER
ncbi:hypothetical protein ACJW30_11G003900 [Castanea mollissima]